MFRNVDWHTVGRFFVHVLLIALGAAFVAIEQWIAGHNFGAYQVLAMSVNTIVFTAVEKFFMSQGAPLPSSGMQK